MKEFTAWFRQKSRIHNDKPRPPFFNERDLWFASLGANIGFELDGKGTDLLRPVVIVKKFNKETFWGIPTTKKKRSGNYYFEFFYNGINSTTANLSQMRLFASKRLAYKIGSISNESFVELKNASPLF